jgi:hypothetical protein
LFCPQCGLKQPAEHRFCLSCGTPLPGHLLRKPSPKISRWYLGIPVAREDPPNSALRVSRYLEEFEIHSAEGSVRIPDHHVRFSVWDGDRAVAAVSIPDTEAEDLARFLLASFRRDEAEADGPVTSPAVDGAS